MKNLNILDCTLRDDGYYNNWKFHKININTCNKKRHHKMHSGSAQFGWRYIRKRVSKTADGSSVF